jgi:hypothetical protein
MSHIVKFPGREPAVERYDDDDDLRHAEHFRCLHTRIDDCAIMSSFAMEELEKCDDGKSAACVRRLPLGRNDLWPAASLSRRLQGRDRAMKRRRRFRKRNRQRIAVHARRLRQ